VILEWRRTLGDRRAHDERLSGRSGPSRRSNHLAWSRPCRVRRPFASPRPASTLRSRSVSPYGSR